jgi:hypothetical protein
MTERPRPVPPKALLPAMLLLGVQSLATLILPQLVPHEAARMVGIALGLVTLAAFGLAALMLTRRRGARAPLPLHPAQGPLTPPPPQANEAP